MNSKTIVLLPPPVSVTLNLLDAFNFPRNYPDQNNMHATINDTRLDFRDHFKKYIAYTNIGIYLVFLFIRANT